MIHSITSSCFPVFGKFKCTKYEVRSVSSGLDWHFRPFSDAVVVSEKKSTSNIWLCQKKCVTLQKLREHKFRYICTL